MKLYWSVYLKEVMKNINNLENMDYLNNISDLISEAKGRVQINLNSEMVLLYWNIGKYIRINIYRDEDKEYGKKIISTLSGDLTDKFGRGYGKSNLFNMIKFYDEFSNFEIVQTLSGQLNWSHILEILKIDDELKCEFYITMIAHERWSVRTLKERINSMLYENSFIQIT